MKILGILNLITIVIGLSFAVKYDDRKEDITEADFYIGQWMCSNNLGTVVNYTSLVSTVAQTNRVMCFFIPFAGAMHNFGDYYWQFREWNTTDGPLTLSVGVTPYFGLNATYARGFIYDSTTGIYGEDIKRGDTIDFHVKLDKDLTEVNVVHNGYFLGPLYKVQAFYDKKLYPMVSFQGTIDLTIARKEFNGLPTLRSRLDKIANIYRPVRCRATGIPGFYSFACNQYVFYISLLKPGRFPKNATEILEVKYIFYITGLNSFFGTMETKDGEYYTVSIIRSTGKIVDVNHLRAEKLFEILFRDKVRIEVISKTNIKIEKSNLRNENEEVMLQLYEVQNPQFPITKFYFDEI